MQKNRRYRRKRDIGSVTTLEMEVENPRSAGSFYVIDDDSIYMRDSNQNEGSLRIQT